jgi:Holliday junction DNA helicase RuvB
MDEIKRTAGASKLTEENKIENSLRPQALDDFIGQDKLKNNLKVFIEAAKKARSFGSLLVLLCTARTR